MAGRETTPARTSLFTISTHSAETTIRVPIITPLVPITMPTPRVTGAEGRNAGSENFSADLIVSSSMNCASNITFSTFLSPECTRSAVLLNSPDR